MLNRLVFEKISENNPIAGVGTAGNIWIVMNAILNIREQDRIFIDMEKNRTINNEKEKIFNTYNAWEYYFEQAELDGKSVNDLDFHNLRSKIDYHKFYTNQDSVSINLRKRFWENFKLKKGLQSEIDKYVLENIRNKKTLGVQIRLTDMTGSHNVEAFEAYVSRVNDIVKSRPEIQQVFLATDDETIINRFQASISRPVVYINNIYRATDKKRDLDPYDRCEYVRPNHLYLLGKEVLLDIFVLSNCQYILRADVSSVSLLAVIFSETAEKVFFMRSKLLNNLKVKVLNIKKWLLE